MLLKVIAFLLFIDLWSEYNYLVKIGSFSKSKFAIFNLNIKSDCFQIYSEYSGYDEFSKFWLYNIIGIFPINSEYFKYIWEKIRIYQKKNFHWAKKNKKRMFLNGDKHDALKA